MLVGKPSVEGRGEGGGGGVRVAVQGKPSAIEKSPKPPRDSIRNKTAYVFC